MFDLKKDIEKYKGITPYASEHYGVYQPLLGWESKLTKNWLQSGGILINPQIKRILDGRILPGPENVINPHPSEFLAMPLQPGVGKSPFKVILTKDMNSELLKIVKTFVQTFVDNNGGRLPEGKEWNQLIEINNMLDAEDGPLRIVNDIYRKRLNQEIEGKKLPEITPEIYAVAKKKHLELMQYESQISTFLLFYAEGQLGFDPNELKKLFSVQVAPPLSDLFRSTDPFEHREDPLAAIDPRSKNGALSPIGFVHLFRQYFFDLGTFLGEPVEHIWLAPGTTIELIEVSTRKTTIERTQENTEETTARSEESMSVKDELSDAVKSENSSSTKLGVSTTNTVSFGVYQGTATASLGLDSTRKDAREAAHKQNREQSEKLSSEIKRSFKSVFKTVTETTDTRSRRYVLQNNGPDLINYELRRKMRRVGVQLQDLGTQLCWQVFIDNAGANLGLAELVHFAESPDLSNLKGPEIGPPPAPILKKVSLPIQFQSWGTHDDKGADYGHTKQRPGEPYTGNRTNTNDEDEEDKEIVMGPFAFKCDPPQSNYELVEVRRIGPQGNKQAIAQAANIIKIQNDKGEWLPADGSFTLVFDRLNFGGETSFSFDVELVFAPLEAARNEYEKAKAEATAKYDAEKQRLLKKSFMESVRQRIKAASNIKSRPSWDLREEERTIIYRQLIKRLMMDSWDMSDKDKNPRLIHVRSEVIRTIFDVDAMLYFVAPEWWMPHEHSQLSFDPNAPKANDPNAPKANDPNAPKANDPNAPKANDPNAPKANDPNVIHLTENDTVKWSDIEKRKDNYKITEDSTPAKLGSSLGWLLQLDGDNLRNAFLNAPWVKAVIPIRPGREKAALNWLRAIEGHENDGWDTPYTAATKEDFQLVAELAAENPPKEPTIGNILDKIADKLERENSDIKNVLQADKVFETGFDHLQDGFAAGLPANQVFSQWVSVLPTDQIVAVEYKPANLLEQ